MIYLSPLRQYARIVSCMLLMLLVGAGTIHARPIAEDKACAIATKF